MSSALDQSLEQIAAARRTTRKPRRGARGIARGVVDDSPAVKGATGVRARYAGPVPTANGNRVTTPTTAAPPLQTEATKILVSNLPIDVNEPQVRELFASTVGPTREVTLSYDAKGNSKGIASVSFTKRGDASKAFAQYNGRLVDGKRPMKIEIIVDPARPPTLSQRVAPAPIATPAPPMSGAAANGAATSVKVRPRLGRRGGRRVKKTGDRPNKSAADLDAEMEDYSKATTEPGSVIAA